MTPWMPSSGSPKKTCAPHAQYSHQDVGRRSAMGSSSSVWATCASQTACQELGVRRFPQGVVHDLHNASVTHASMRSRPELHATHRPVGEDAWDDLA